MEEGKESWSGRIEAPHEIHDGFQMRVETLPIRPQSGMTAFQECRDLSEFRGALLALTSTVGDDLFTWGTACLIAPGLAVTAAHIILEFEEAGHFKNESYALLASGLVAQTVNTWVVTGACLVGETDVAVLSMELRGNLPPSGVMTVLPMTTRAPLVGETVYMLGFRAGGEKFTRVDGGMEIDMTILESVGVVSDLFFNGRDRVLLPGACFAVNARAVGGMSGGAVFNQDGNMIGVISSSDNADDEHTTMVSLLWAAMLAELNPPWPPKWYPPNVKLIDQPLGTFLYEAENLHVIDDPRSGERRMIRTEPLPVR